MSETDCIRILLADDHEIVRLGLRQVLTDEFDGIEFGEAANAAAALEQLATQDWDLLILDINLPGRNGLEVLAESRQRWPNIPVVVLSMSAAEEFAVRVLRDGASAYVSKASVSPQLIDAVRSALQGSHYITAEQAQWLAQSVSWSGDAEHLELSPRELQVMHLIAKGNSVREIAAALQLSDKTVFTYRDRLRVKLRLKTDVEIARYALQRGLSE